MEIQVGVRSSWIARLPGSIDVRPRIWSRLRHKMCSTLELQITISPVTLWTTKPFINGNQFPGGMVSDQRRIASAEQSVWARDDGWGGRISYGRSPLTAPRGSRVRAA